MNRKIRQWLLACFMFLLCGGAGAQIFAYSFGAPQMREAAELTASVAGGEEDPVILVPLHSEIRSTRELDQRLSIRVEDPAGKVHMPEFSVQRTTDAYRITLERPRTYMVGTHVLSVMLNPAPGVTRKIQSLTRRLAGRAGESRKTIDLLQADVYYGGLLLNTDIVALTAGDSVGFSVALPDAPCTGDVTLTLRDGQGRKAVASTEKGTVTATPPCTPTGVLAAEDFHTAIRLPWPDSYDVEVRANGRVVRTRRSTVAARDLDIRRKASTRTFPGKTEEMVLSVDPQRTVAAAVSEVIPPGFVIEDVEPGRYEEEQLSDGSTKLTWKRIWKTGEPVDIRYRYATPDTGTALVGQFGPVEATLIDRKYHMDAMHVPIVQKAHAQANNYTLVREPRPWSVLIRTYADDTALHGFMGAAPDESGGELILSAVQDEEEEGLEGLGLVTTADLESLASLALTEPDIRTAILETAFDRNGHDLADAMLANPTCVGIFRQHGVAGTAVAHRVRSDALWADIRRRLQESPLSAHAIRTSVPEDLMDRARSGLVERMVERMKEGKNMDRAVITDVVSSIAASTTALTDVIHRVADNEGAFRRLCARVMLPSEKADEAGALLSVSLRDGSGAPVDVRHRFIEDTLVAFPANEGEVVSGLSLVEVRVRSPVSGASRVMVQEF